MLTIEGLRQLGVNVDEGLKRCMNNEAFYLRLADMAINDRNFARLEQAAADGDWTGAFEAAHALKGALGNLSLTPLYTTVCELTDLLRPGLPVDCKEPIARMKSEHAALQALRG